MLGVDLPAGLPGRVLDLLARNPRLGRGQLRAEPAVRDPPDTLQGLRAATTEPHLERLLNGASRGRNRAEGPSLGLMVDRLAGPPRAQEREDLLEHRAASGAGRHQRVSLGRLLDPGHEAEQQPTVRDLVKLRQLLGKHERVTTERHHIRTEPHPIGRTREQRDAKQWIQNRRDWQIGQPDPVKTARFDRAAECDDLLARQRARMRSDR